ncbi:MAG: hypothetical protein Q4B14_05065, partial [Clostridia bacterium]|nr:hypothetical protein [Clostridia bacterium]
MIREDKDKFEEMDQQMYDLCMDKLREVYKIAIIMDCEAQFSELDGSIPALAIAVNSKGNDKEPRIVVVAFLPMNVGGSDKLIAQIMVSISEQIPMNKRREVEELIQFFNNVFTLGKFSVIGEVLLSRYAFYADEGVDIDQVLYSKTILMLAKEADTMEGYLEMLLQEDSNIDKLIDEICDLYG